MGTIWFRMRSELKWREVEVSSTFITVGELRALICDKLELDQKTDTVNLISETDTEPFADSKQLPRGSRVRAIRTTLEHLERLQSERKEAAQKQRAAKEVKATEAKSESVEQQHDSDDEFGPSVFDLEAQRRYEQRVAALKASEGAAKRQEDARAQSDAEEDEEHTPALPRIATAAAAAPPSYIESEEPGTARDDASSVPLDRLLGFSVPVPAPSAVPKSPSKTAAPPGSLPAIAVRSILEAHTEMHWLCRRFMPRGPVELVFDVLGIPRPLTRAQWRSFVLQHGGRDPEGSPTPPRELRRARSQSRGASPRRRRSPSRDRSRSARRLQPRRSPSPSRSRSRSDMDRRSSKTPADGGRRDRQRHRHRRTSKAAPRSRQPRSDSDTDEEPRPPRRRRSRSAERPARTRRDASPSESSDTSHQRRRRRQSRSESAGRWYDQPEAQEETPEPPKRASGRVPADPKTASKRRRHGTRSSSPSRTPSASGSPPPQRLRRAASGGRRVVDRIQQIAGTPGRAARGTGAGARSGAAGSGKNMLFARALTDAAPRR